MCKFKWIIERRQNNLSILSKEQSLMFEELFKILEKNPELFENSDGLIDIKLQNIDSLNTKGMFKKLQGILK